MKQEHFLTIYAVFDNETQEKLNRIQQRILGKYSKGTQTMGIPFHISLGSFPVEDKAMLIEKIGKNIEKLKAFPIELEGLGHFNHSVLFIKPKITDELVDLHSIFEGNFSDGYPWTPHTTLYCGEKEDIKDILTEYKVSSIQGNIIGLQLGEFFPPKIILTATF